MLALDFKSNQTCRLLRRLLRVNAMSFASRMRSICPLLVPLDTDGLLYDGFIVVYGDEYRLKVVLPSNGQLAKARLEGDLKLRNVLNKVSDVVQLRLNESSSLPEFLQELQAILENQLKKTVPDLSVAKPPKYYALLIEELNSTGWHRLVHVDALLGEVHVKFVDKGNREHILKLEFPDEYPEKPPKANADLPIPFEINWTKQQGQTLFGILNQYDQCLEQYQLLWSILEDVDGQLWVLDPEQPRRSDVTRRVALGNCSSLIFTVDPLNPKARPTWQLLGSDKVIDPLQETLNCNFERDWDVNLGLVENWRNLLRIEMPSRLTSKLEDIQVDCAICYSYKLADNIPEVSCAEKRCKQVFHAVCLYEWLKSCSTSRQTYNIIFGECPQCAQAITCKVPQP